MSLPTAFLSEDQFTCSICLEIFTNPVSTPCGHSFCQSCLTSYWNSGGRGRGAKTYQCPMCKDSFNKRPELHINRTLKEITEHFKQMTGGGEHPSLAGQHPAMSPPVRPGEMPEVLIAEMVARFQGLTSPGTPHQRFPQPLQASQTQDSHDPPPPYSPPLSYSGGSFSDFPSNMPLCPVHLRGLDMFCRTDNMCVCSVCAETAEHRGHSIIPAQREWNIKKSQLGIHEVELKELICERERKVEEIHKSVREMKAAAELETDGVVCALTKLISTVEHCQSIILETIETTVQTAESRAQSLLTELEEEIAALRKRSSTLSQLAASEDYVHFFKTFPAVSTPPQAKDWSNVSLPSQTSEAILRTVNQTVESLQLEIQKLPQLCQQSSPASPVPRPSLKVRRVQEYAEEITLDPSTAHPRLIISPDGKQVQCGERYQLVLDHPQRFDRVVCVMAHQGFTSGRHYWEVDVGNKTDWDLGVASRSVIRKGKISVNPAHGYWFLSLRDQTDYAFRTDPSTPLTVTVRPTRVGIYIDYDKGLLSFYNVEAKLLIYSFTDSFPDTIHPFFSPCTNKSGRNGAPLVICPVSMTQ